MKHVLALGAVALVLVAGYTVAQDAVKSGPQVGEKVPGPFHPLNITGENAGEKHCLYCENGPAPVAVVFARELTPAVSGLIKKIDAETAKNSKKGMGSYVVFLSASEELPKQAKALAEKEAIKTTVLSVDNPAGPTRYNVAKDAEVTVLLYTDFVVEANHSFRKGELNDGAITKVVADVAKIVK